MGEGGRAAPQGRPRFSGWSLELAGTSPLPQTWWGWELPPHWPPAVSTQQRAPPQAPASWPAPARAGLWVQGPAYTALPRLPDGQEGCALALGGPSLAVGLRG